MTLVIRACAEAGTGMDLLEPTMLCDGEGTSGHGVSLGTDVSVSGG